jgi:hypothetical protein
MRERAENIVRDLIFGPARMGMELRVTLPLGTKTTTMIGALRRKERLLTIHFLFNLGYRLRLQHYKVADGLIHFAE